MKKLIAEIKELKQSEVGKKVDERLKIFQSYKNKSNEEWFSELCFCILTANSKMLTAKAIQEELGTKGFLKNSEDEIRDCIKRNKHRFHNNKAKFIVEARKNKDIKDKVRLAMNESIEENESKRGNETKRETLAEIGKEAVIDGEMKAREWLVTNIKGLGYKEASHFLRNTGCMNLAIVDRHVQNILVEHKILSEKPKGITKKVYLDIEKKLDLVCQRSKMSQAELDMYLFSIKTGQVYK